MVKNRTLERRPFTAVTGVRIPVGTPNSKKPLHHSDSGFFISFLYVELLKNDYFEKSILLSLTYFLPYTEN